MKITIHVIIYLELILELFLGLKSTPIYRCPICDKSHEYANNLGEIPTNCHVIGHIMLDESSGNGPTKITFDNLTNGVTIPIYFFPCKIFDQLN